MKDAEWEERQAADVREKLLEIVPIGQRNAITSQDLLRACMKNGVAEYSYLTVRRSMVAVGDIRRRGPVRAGWYRPDSTARPCPFCGGRAESGEYTSASGAVMHFVQCSNTANCAVVPTTGNWPTEAGAIGAWNERHTPTDSAPSDTREEP